MDYYTKRLDMQRLEMNKLIEVTSKSLKTHCRDLDSDDLKRNIEKALDDDILKITSLNNLKNSDDPFPFIYNKLLDLLTQAKKFLHLHWQHIVEGNSARLLTDSKGISWEGTSVLNYMQTTLLEILSVIYKTRVCDLQVLKEAGNIYQVETSPNLQTVKIINKIVEKRNEKLDITRGWRWSLEITDQTEDETDDERIFPKLVVPMLGFYMGGSRFDSKYADKLFRAHDASSLISGLLDIDESFTTVHVKALADAEFARSLVDHKRNISILEKTKRVLVKRASASMPEPGNVFIAKFYIGFVVDVINDMSNSKRIKIVGCNRFMPYIEGLVIEEYVLQESGQWLKSWENVHGDELRYYAGPTNENEKNVVVDSVFMHFFNVIANVD